MVRIRLTRMGKKKQPFYRIVVVDQRKRRDGAYIESLGYYDPIKDPYILNVDVDKAVDWILKGAQPSQTVKNLLRKAGVFKKVDEIKRTKKKEENQ
ncbi:30S ribosomal protein S16 [Thermosipho melanesiensis]|uniref:Small ribosomal subunit protein bS16 n=2 Tax=Thermosipho melanesiensis TaxID=46541 RepID=RS16_THEM4|nr:30S ribosomal protein S16 [Thermosipho melanesiensis]A6LNY9.1 RecName: Full=Small ribosomal subunit protein bS16; AltName: Full=30S ribosomal protein S16 [Thermosipho melanesiensis BI429]ABR31640.1 ribosomal protein S16 [Thermosipho melanesiensis BI429]APT74669.1 30S ribosomal protein S16 [Thermosipho melanesiensis]OOC35168.1 30S ribosomal protein S16 [Thermosipho melanesiensis]OOC35378.1 30S ribosomal protein S16 [Thermosipho melanesiensis]OOC36629.1 30S ribosomal protein S16 [Thermosipho